jgi:hypothetical protein
MMRLIMPGSCRQVIAFQALGNNQSAPPLSFQVAMTSALLTSNMMRLCPANSICHAGSCITDV